MKKLLSLTGLTETGVDLGFSQAGISKKKSKIRLTFYDFDQIDIPVFLKPAKQPLVEKVPFLEAFWKILTRVLLFLARARPLNLYLLAPKAPFTIFFTTGQPKMDAEKHDAPVNPPLNSTKASSE